MPKIAAGTQITSSATIPLMMIHFQGSFLGIGSARSPAAGIACIAVEGTGGCEGGRDGWTTGGFEGGRPTPAGAAS